MNIVNLINSFLVASERIVGFGIRVVVFHVIDHTLQNLLLNFSLNLRLVDQFFESCDFLVLSRKFSVCFLQLHERVVSQNSGILYVMVVFNAVRWCLEELLVGKAGRYELSPRTEMSIFIRRSRRTHTIDHFRLNASIDTELSLGLFDILGDHVRTVLLEL